MSHIGHIGLHCASPEGISLMRKSNNAIINGHIMRLALDIICLLVFSSHTCPQIRAHSSGSDKRNPRVQKWQIGLFEKPSSTPGAYLQVGETNICSNSFRAKAMIYFRLSPAKTLSICWICYIWKYLNASRLIPGLRGCKPLGMWAGLRPATQHADYQISFRWNG